jgi:hypothetical protein
MFAIHAVLAANACNTDRKAHSGVNEPSRLLAARPVARCMDNRMDAAWMLLWCPLSPMPPVPSYHFPGDVQTLVMIPSKDDPENPACQSSVRLIPCWRGESYPLCKSLLIPGISGWSVSNASEGAHPSRTLAYSTARNTQSGQRRSRGTAHGGEREIEVRQHAGVSIRSCFCVSPES